MMTLIVMCECDDVGRNWMEHFLRNVMDLNVDVQNMERKKRRRIGTIHLCLLLLYLL